MHRWGSAGSVLRVVVATAFAAGGLVVATTGSAAGTTAPWPPGRYRAAVFPGITTATDVVYGFAIDQSDRPVALTLDLSEPVGDAAAHRPAVVWVHGGGFTSGDKRAPEIVDLASTFAHKGFVSASIDYRIAPGSGCAVRGREAATCWRAITDARHDAQEAVRFLRANAVRFRVDPRRIAIAGISAGGITALNVGFGADGPDSAVAAAVSLSGAALGVRADRGDAPALLLHGRRDAIVPYDWARATERDASRAGVPVHLTTWARDGHVPYLRRHTEILDQITMFLWSHLELASAGGLVGTFGR